MTKPFGVAVVGYGGMGSWHTRELQSIEGIRLSGAYDILPERRRICEENGIRAFSSLEEVLSDPDTDLVTIATPTDVHLEIAVRAMRAGKHVVCEKPVSMNVAELEEMISAANETGRLFTVHQNRRWDEDYLMIRKIYEEGTLGTVYNIESRVHGSRGVPGDWRNTVEHGGGMVLDWGVHLYDQILTMIPYPVSSVYAELTHVTNDVVDDGFRVLLHFDAPEGKTAPLCLVEVGTSNFINLPRWYMCGENGSAVIEDWEKHGRITMVSHWEDREAVPVVAGAGLTKTMAPRSEDTIENYPLPEMHSDVRDFYRDVMDAARTGREPRIRHAELLRQMRLVEAIFRSAETGQAVSVHI